MPPFVTAECTNPKCRRKNRYDLAELKKDGGYIYSGYVYKGTIHRLVEADEEMIVVCEKCGQRFKITIPHTDVKRGWYRDAEID